MSLRFLDFFAGVGGFHVALARAGMVPAGACEIDPFARRVYEARFGAPPWFPEDITKVKPEEIPAADVWSGGSPCQGFSVAGKRGGLEDDRSGLLRVWLDLLEAKKPRFLLFENVFGIFSANGGRDWGEFVARLDEIGFAGAWVVRDARWFGVPQRRRRVFLVAERGGDPSTACATLFEGGQPSSPPLFRSGYRWSGGQASLFGPAAGADQPPSDWGSSGRWAAGRCETAPWPEAPSDPVPSSLAALLERDAVPPRFFLSPRAASGILRRAERRGRDLPASLRGALDRVAALAVPGQPEEPEEGDEAVDEGAGDDGDRTAPPLKSDASTNEEPMAFYANAGTRDMGYGSVSPTLKVGSGAGGVPVPAIILPPGAARAPTPRALKDDESASYPMDGQKVMGALTRTYGSGAELHPDRMGRDSNQLVIGVSDAVVASALSGTPPTVAVVDSPLAPAASVLDVVGTLTPRVGGSGQGWATYNEAEHLVPDVVGALTAPSQDGGGWRAGADEAAAGHIVDVAAYAIRGGSKRGKADAQAVDIVTALMARSPKQQGNSAGMVVMSDPEPEMYQCHGSNVGPAGTLRRGNGNVAGGIPFLEVPLPQEPVYLVPPENPDFVEQAVSAKWSKGSGGPSGDERHNLVLSAPAAIPAEPMAFDLAQITSAVNRTNPKYGQPAPALAATNRIHVAGDVANTIRAADGHHGHSSPRGDGCDNLMPVDLQNTNLGHDATGTIDTSRPTRGGGQGVTVPSHGVRRLTPTETERLQGLPDGWTCLCGAAPYSTTGCTCPDGPRYRVCGNGVAVPCVEWIAKRLAAAAAPKAIAAADGPAPTRRARARR